MRKQNFGVYSSDVIVKWYANSRGLLEAERIVFELYQERVANARLLDIGIGAGRTSAFLIKACKHYTGIDYSEKLVKATRQKFPDADLRVMDGGDLSAFETGSFDFVNFSLNGIDYVDLEDRERIISEIARVLKPSGIFFFSTHNKSHSSSAKAPWRNPASSPFINFKTFVRVAPFFIRHLLKKKHERFEKDYAILNNWAHNYRLLTFHTTPALLREQLLRNRFGQVQFLSRQGVPKPDEELDDWVFTIAHLRS